MRGMWLSLFCAGALLATAAATPAQARVSADINIHVGRGPSVYFDRQPQVILVPGTRVYYVDDLDYDMYECGGWWYVDDGDSWYRSRDYNGPFVSISFSILPHELIAASGYGRYGYDRSRHYGGSGYGGGYGDYDRRDGRWRDRQGRDGRNDGDWRSRDRRDNRDHGQGDRSDRGGGWNRGDRRDRQNGGWGGNGRGQGRDNGRGNSRGRDGGRDRRGGGDRDD